MISENTVIKTYLSANELIMKSYEMAANILLDGFKPDFIVAIWRGGTPVGIAVQELMEYAGISTDHIAIRTSSYVGIGEQKEVRVHNLGYLIDSIEHHHKLLIVDDVFDSGRSVDAVLRDIHQRSKRNTPHEIKIATPYYKPKMNKTDRVPDYFVVETDDWIVFPHELCGLSKEEVYANKPGLREILTPLQEMASAKE